MLSESIFLNNFNKKKLLRSRNIYSLYLLTLCLILSKPIKAQVVNVPSIHSQYINQSNDLSAIKVYLKYEVGSKKVYFLINEEAQEFTQKNLYNYCQAYHKNLKPSLAKQVVLQVHAPKNIPFHYLSDLYTWSQIQGNFWIHMVGREGSQLKYIPIDIMPFGKLEQACQYYATKNKLASQSPLEILQQLHPNTTSLEQPQESEETLALTASAVPKRSQDYVPHQLLNIEIKAGNEVYFKGKKVNPMILGTLLQADISSNYKASMTTASPHQFLWVNIQADQTVVHESYLAVLVAIQEGFYLYWDELSFNEYQKTYQELTLVESLRIKDSSPMLITQYDAIQYNYINDKLQAVAKGKRWADLEKLADE